EAVVGRIVDGAVEDAIQAQQPGFLVELVLVLAAFGNLDDDGERRCDDSLVDVAVVPRVHHASVLRMRWSPIRTATGPGRRQWCSRPGPRVDGGSGVGGRPAFREEPIPPVGGGR